MVLIRVLEGCYGFQKILLEEFLGAISVGRGGVGLDGSVVIEGMQSLGIPNPAGNSFLGLWFFGSVKA